MMKKKFIIGAAMVAAMMLHGFGMAAEGNPSCALMRFTDDTRYDRVESAPTLSDLVMEKLLNSGKFNFKETKVIDQDMEKMLYDEKNAMFQNARYAVDNGNYDVLFEGPGFSENQAETIASAQLGQIVNPEVVGSIGNQHQADYLIQGTILNLGSGDWMDNRVANTVQYASTAVALTGSPGAANMLGALGPLASLASAVNVKKTGVGVQADLKLIKVSTGEVIWKKTVVGKNIQKQYSVIGIKVGSDKLNNEMYFNAMDQTAQLIADALIADAESGKLFVK